VDPEPPVPLLKQRGRPPLRRAPPNYACAGEAVTRRLQKVKRILVEEAGGCCAVCGYDRCMVNLHFHHVDPATKRRDPVAAGRR